MINQPTGTRQLPPLGHLTVRALTRILLDTGYQRTSPPSSARPSDELNDIRSELQRRERLGVGLRP